MEILVFPRVTALPFGAISVARVTALLLLQLIKLSSLEQIRFIMKTGAVLYCIIVTKAWQLL